MKHLLAACLLLLATTVLAGSDVDLRQQIMQRLSQQPTHRFHFVQEKTLAVLAKPLVTEGELLLGADNTVTWDIQQPYQLRYVLTRDRIREIDDKGERVLMTAQNPLAAALGQAMAATFSGKWQDAASVATVAASGSVDAWQLQVTPQSAELQTLITGITVSGHQDRIDQVIIAEQSGDTATIRLSPLTP